MHFIFKHKHVGFNHMETINGIPYLRRGIVLTMITFPNIATYSLVSFEPLFILFRP